jgi:hypothetical protein
MHAPHVKSFAVRICDIWAISRPLKVCALFKRLDEPGWSALSGHVSSREDTVWDDSPVTLPSDPDLHCVVEAWDRLPEAFRQGIRAMVRAGAESPRA